MVKIVLVAAVGQNGVIGVGDRLPWRLPTDMLHFRALTLGRPVVMGRRTFEGIGRPLPGRRMIIVSRQAGYASEGVDVAASVAAALARGRALAAADGGDAVMVAGGAAIYAAALPEADRLELTEVQLTLDGDTWFPAFDRRDWRETARRGPERGPDDDAAMVFVTLERLGS